MSSVPSSGDYISGYVRFRDTPSLSSAPSGTKSESIAKALERMKQHGITATALLPLSSRGILVNVLRVPISFGKSLYTSFKEAIHGKSITVFGATFMREMGAHWENIQKAWHGGISDFDIDLTTPENKEKGKQIARDNMKYAGYMYQNNFNGDVKEGFEAVYWKGYSLTANRFAKMNKPDIRTIIGDNVVSPLLDISKELAKMGFVEDKNLDGKSNGLYYCQETGVIFSLALDTTDPGKPEVILSFEGFGNAEFLHTTQKKSK